MRLSLSLNEMNKCTAGGAQPRHERCQEPAKWATNHPPVSHSGGRSPCITPLLSVCLSLLLAADVAAGNYFTIAVVDNQTGRGVPLVELRTVHNVRYYTDSNGVVAFHEPGLMGKTVFFHVQSHGYEFPKDGFGFRGKALEVKEDG